ncbi:MAG: hypothetical protein KQI35_19135 [Bacteroidetes bacterium]|nr:hypothetical protein [Bacteroidota bacterium]
MKKTYVLILAFMMLVGIRSSLSCTIVYYQQDKISYVANNLDVENVFARIWFIPSDERHYGRMCFGTEQPSWIAEGGMNDQGLYISVNALLNPTDWEPDPALPDWETWEGWFETGVPDGILAMCATVDDALAVFQSYNLLTFKHVKFLLADKTGRSVVLEWHDGDLRILERGLFPYQVSTNFVYSACSPDSIPCYRYTLAMRRFNDPNTDPPVVKLKKILNLTHMEFNTPTVYSNICNLNTGDVTLYYFHDFETSFRFNLHQQLQEGAHAFRLNELFPEKSYVAHVYEDYYNQLKAKQ